MAFHSALKLFSFLLLFLSSSVQAQIIYEDVTPFGKALESIGLAKIYGKNALTVEQIKECLALFERARNQKSQIDTNLREHNENLENVSKLEHRIDQTQVNEYSRTSVENYNHLVDEYESLWAKIEKFQSQREAKRRNYNTLVNKTNKLCSNRNYYQEDLEQALQDLKASIRNN